MEQGATSFGVAYFGVRDPDHALDDLAEIAGQGFDWVLLPFTHDDAAYELPTFTTLVGIARRVGLTPIVSPWGGGEFGGEGVRSSMPLPDWIESVRATGAGILHVDEPKRRGTTIADILDLWADDAGVWLTIEPERHAELSPEVVGRVAVLGTDAYTGLVDERVAATRAFGAATGRLDLAWVRAFRIAAGEEELVEASTLALAELAPRVGVWAWKGSTGRGELRSERPRLVQEAVARAIARVRARSAAA